MSSLFSFVSWELWLTIGSELYTASERWWNYCTEAGMQRIAAYWETEWEGSMPPKGKDTLKPDKDVAHQK